MKKKKEKQVKTFVECHNTCARKTEVMRTRIKFWSDREIRAAFDKRGGKYKGILQQLMMERDYAFQRQIRYYVNVDIDKFMRRLS